MFAMAVDAQGSVDVAFEGLPAVDALFIFVKNEGVAFSAGLRILGRQMRLSDALDVVDSVAVRANGGKRRQAFLEEGFAVNALHIFLIGRFGMDVVLHDDAHVFVAAGTHERDVLPVDGRGRVLGLFDIVLAVAIPAFCDILHAPLEVGFAVDAVGIIEGALSRSRQMIFLVAFGRAIGRWNIFFLLMGELCGSPFHRDLVAVRTGEIGVDRC